MARGSAWIGSRITTPNPDVARNSNTSNNERSFVSVKKTYSSNSVCVLLKLIIFAVNISIKYFCFTYLISRNYLVKQHICFHSLNQNGVMNSFACCMILRFVLSAYFLILEMLPILNENFNLCRINFLCIAESKIAWFTHYFAIVVWHLKFAFQ